MGAIVDILHVTYNERYRFLCVLVMNLTKRDIAQAIHEAEPTISVAEAVHLLDTIFQAIKDRLGRDGKVMITNFGTFRVLERAPRQGINPATGEPLTIRRHRAVSFRPAPALQEAVNGQQAPAGHSAPAAAD